MNLGDDVPPFVPPSISLSESHVHSGRHSLPPTNALGPHHVLPPYPSSSLCYYYPSVSPSHFPQNAAHISAFSQLELFITQPYDTNNFGHPTVSSVSQFHIPSLRHIPSSHHSVAHHINDIDSQKIPNSPLSHQRNNINFQHTVSLSPAAFVQHISPIIAPQLPLLANPIPPPLLRSPSVRSSISLPPPTHTIFSPPYSKPSLPSTTDIPLLSRKHDWGPWHAAVPPEDP
jgi:hypothetical protein